MHSPGNPKLPIVDLSYLHVNKSKLSMNFNIALTMETRAGIKSHILSNLSIYLKEVFKYKDYGADLLNYTLGFTSVLAPEGYVHCFEKRSHYMFWIERPRTEFQVRSIICSNYS